MGVEIVLGFHVAEQDGVREVVRLAIAIDLVEGLVEDFEFLLFHFDQTPHEEIAAFAGKTGKGLVEVVAEGGVSIGGEAGLVDGLFLVDDGGRLLAFLFAMSSSSGLFVGLPFFLFRIAHAHFYYGAIIDHE